MTRKQLYLRFATAALATLLTAVTGAWLTVLIVQPGYENPRSRIYTSKLGRANQTRSTNLPFDVRVCTVQTQATEAVFVGEGMLQTEAVQVPIIAMSRITAVNAEEGQAVRKGQVLVELDSSRLEIKVRACQAALNIAKSEFERTRIGSAYVLDMERPLRDTIRLDGVAREGKLLDELNRMYIALEEEVAISRAELIEHQLRIEQHRTRLKETTLALKRAQEGKTHSLDVAKAAIREAELAIDHRINELRDYQVICPVDGLVERRFVHPGEYNQDPGRPAFLVTTGLWFEAHFDQTTWGDFEVGDRTELRLESHPGRVLEARVTKIHPYITYSLGGPEVNRPIRPLGSGAPEWPSTYKVRFELIEETVELAPGMTGFARVLSSRPANVIPRSAVRSLSAGQALVLVAYGDRVKPRRILVGRTSAEWVEVLEGVSSAEQVIYEGHETIVEGDRVRVLNRPTENGDPDILVRDHLRGEVRG